MSENLNQVKTLVLNYSVSYSTLFFCFVYVACFVRRFSVFPAFFLVIVCKSPLLAFSFIAIFTYTAKGTNGACL